MKRLSVTIEWGRDEHEPDWSSQGTDALVEVAGAPERRQMGFRPPSDPMRRGDDDE